MDILGVALHCVLSWETNSIIKSFTSWSPIYLNNLLNSVHKCGDINSLISGILPTPLAIAIANTFAPKLIVSNRILVLFSGKNIKPSLKQFTWINTVYENKTCFFREFISNYVTPLPNGSTLAIAKPHRRHYGCKRYKSVYMWFPEHVLVFVRYRWTRASKNGFSVMGIKWRKCCHGTFRCSTFFIVTSSEWKVVFWVLCFSPQGSCWPRWYRRQARREGCKGKTDSIILKSTWTTKQHNCHLYCSVNHLSSWMLDLLFALAFVCWIQSITTLLTFKILTERSEHKKA